MSSGSEKKKRKSDFTTAAIRKTKKPLLDKLVQQVGHDQSYLIERLLEFFDPLSETERSIVLRKVDDADVELLWMSLLVRRRPDIARLAEQLGHVAGLHRE